MSINQANWWPQPQQHEMMESLSSNTSSLNPRNTTVTFWSNPQFFTPISSPGPASCSPNSGLGFDLNTEEDEKTDPVQLTEERDHEILKEPLFEKALTPSDVGKLNRLVIPKQHAEKYFPLNGVSESGEKGLLLSFEDVLGKPWRFRYSYWNSSQSYVLTKGWSRFVKEKRLDAGDVVHFERHGVDSERFFIGWRRRRSVRGLESQAAQPPGVVGLTSGSGGGHGSGGWARLLFCGQPYPAQPAPALPYPPDGLHAGGEGMQNGTTASGSGNCKRLRLFGVNLEWQEEAPAPSDDSGSSASSNQGPDPASYQNPHHYYPSLLANYNHPSHVDTNFPRDMSQTRYQQG